MDRTKQPLGIVTMVYKDYFFLQRWYDYYQTQVGAENLFVFSHGGDPRHQELAPNANVINVPRDKTMFKFDRRRWLMLSQFASGMLEMYNWMIVADVDEIVIVDPDVAPNIVNYITEEYGDENTAPLHVCPFSLELIHVPEEEKEPVEAGVPILARRRIFRPNRNYSKPCLFRVPITLAPGGHRSNLGKRYLSSHLYSVHLKFFDAEYLRARDTERSNIIPEAIESGSKKAENGPAWSASQAHKRILESTALKGEDVQLPEYRNAMMEQVERYKNQYIFGNIETNFLFRIPERFERIF